MAVKAHSIRGDFNKGNLSAIAANSLNADAGTLVTYTAASGMAATAATETIAGVSAIDKTFASDNFTVDRKRLLYTPAESLDEVLLDVVGAIALTFDAALVASNTINLKVNGVAMTQITYASSNDATLDAIAAQLVTDFPTIIKYATRTTTRIISITPQPGVTVTLSDIVVAAGASQAAGAQTTVFTVADEGKFYDITTTGVSVATEHASSGQVKLKKLISLNRGWFAIANT